MNVERTESKSSRRDFLAGVLRYGVLGLLGLAGGLAAAKRRRLVRQGRCVNEGVCDNCSILAQCRLPAALTRRVPKP